jgi:hypothetical protein
MTAPGYLPAPLGGDPPTSLDRAASVTTMRRVIEVVNNILSGKMNVVLPVTLAANAGTTTITDVRISYFSALLFSPLTANAAAALGVIYVSSQKSGSAVVTHANNAQTDKSYNMAILG